MLSFWRSVLLYHMGRQRWIKALLHRASTMTLAAQLSLTTIGSLQNGLQPHSLFSLIAMRSVSIDCALTLTFGANGPLQGKKGHCGHVPLFRVQFNLFSPRFWGKLVKIFSRLAPSPLGNPGSASGKAQLSEVINFQTKVNCTEKFELSLWEQKNILTFVHSSKSQDANKGGIVDGRAIKQGLPDGQNHNKKVR